MSDRQKLAILSGILLILLLGPAAAQVFEGRSAFGFPAALFFVALLLPALMVALAFLPGNATNRTTPRTDDRE